jgi:N-acetyl-alpha-D-muramate 1-phosphate uridylyltransferase
MTTDRKPAAVVLAAGLGTRLRPLTDHRPKALCPVDNVPLLDRWLDRLERLGFADAGDVAVNAHHLPDQVVAHVAGRAWLSVERELLGTSGAVGNLAAWRAGRDALVVNADAYLGGPDPAGFLTGWDRVRPRLLVVRDPDREDFPGGWRFAGMSLLAAADADRLPPQPGSLYEDVWRHADLELVPYDGEFHDCGTPADYLAANLHASGGRSVVGPGAEVRGELVRSVVWPGGVVTEGERLVDAIRVGASVTVRAGSGCAGSS